MGESCPYCQTEMVCIDVPATRPEVSAGILLERETKDCFPICPNKDCHVPGSDSGEDFIPF